jgi:hypothetical protein
MSQDLPPLGVISEYSRIPRALYSSETKKPISHCLVCNKYLLADGTSYMLEKAIKQVPDLGVKEVIFEYAMCMKCSMMMNESLSVESRQRINEYFAKHGNLLERRNNFLQKKNFRFSSWINSCVVKNTPISKTSEYQVVAQCDGKNLLYTYMPFAISIEAMNEISELLSEKSLGEIDDFMGKYFTGPPEVSEILKRRLILI